MDKTKIILPILVALVLAGFASWKLSPEEERSIPVPQTAERMFVRVNADSLANSIKRFYSKDVTVDNGNGKFKFVIKYKNNKDVMFHQNIASMKVDTAFLKRECKDEFLLKEEGNDIIIGLTNEKGYVLCPTPILARVLHKMSEERK